MTADLHPAWCAFEKCQIETGKHVGDMMMLRQPGNAWVMSIGPSAGEDVDGYRWPMVEVRGENVEMHDDPVSFYLHPLGAIAFAEALIKQARELLAEHIERIEVSPCTS